MAGEILIFDATGSNIDGTDPGTALEAGPNDDLRVREFSAPAPPQTVQYAGSVDTEGGLPASRKHENRTITVKILCMTAASLRSLQGKVGKIAREGGTLKWILPNAETVIFDLLAADTFEPAIDKLLYVRSGAFCEVQIVLPAKPYGRGSEVDLGDNTETTLPLLIFTDTGVAGDMPGLGRLVIDNDDASNAQGLVLWGVQSRYYSSASTAALFYQAESCSGATIATGPSGASGGGSNNTAYEASLAAAPSWSPMCYLGASGTAQTHIGTFRVFARVRAPAANTGVVSLRIEWQPSIGRSFIGNDSVTLVNGAGAAIEDYWALVDLGQVILPKATSGTQGWLGQLEAQSTVSGDDVYVDWIMFVPVDEGAGQAVDYDTTRQLVTSGTVQVRYDGVLASVSGGYLSPWEIYEGDYLTVPVAGAEARTLRVLVKLARGYENPTMLMAFDGASGVYADGGTDDLSARLFYTPRYLVVPSP